MTTTPDLHDRLATALHASRGGTEFACGDHGLSEYERHQNRPPRCERLADLLLASSSLQPLVELVAAAEGVIEESARDPEPGGGRFPGALDALELAVDAWRAHELTALEVDA